MNIHKLAGPVQSQGCACWGYKPQQPSAKWRYRYMNIHASPNSTVQHYFVALWYVRASVISCCATCL